MWRSIAGRTRQVALKFGAFTQNPEKVLSFQLHHSFSRPSLYRNPRFLSQLSATDPSEDGSVSHEAELSPLGFSQNENSQMDDLDSGFEVGENLGENGDTQIENFVYSDEIPVEPKRDEIDLEKYESVMSVLFSGFDDPIESSLDDLDLDLNENFVVKVLGSLGALEDRVLQFYKWAARKLEFKVSMPIVDALVLGLHQTKRQKVAYALWDLVKESGEKDSGIMNVAVLNMLMEMFVRLGRGKTALEVFNKLGDYGCVADKSTYYNLILGLCNCSLFDCASSVCEEMIDTGSLIDESKAVGKIIGCFCRGKKAKEAHSVYALAKEKKNYPPLDSVNFLISSLCQKDETVKLALEMLDDFPGEAQKSAIKPFSAVIRGLCRMKDVDAAKTLLHKMISEGPPPGNAVFNSVINAYSKNGDMKEATEIMKLMEKRGLKPDVYTYTVIMSGYANGGQMKEACEILSKAKKKHSKLSPATYHTLIRGYCKLEEFDKALNLLSEMKDFGVEPNVDEYNKLIQSLCLRALDWEKAEKLFEEMKEKGLHLNGITRALITAVKDLEREGVDNEGARIEA